MCTNITWFQNVFQSCSIKSLSPNIAYDYTYHTTMTITWLFIPLHTCVANDCETKPHMCTTDYVYYTTHVHHMIMYTKPQCASKTMYAIPHMYIIWLCIVYHITHMYHMTMHCIPHHTHVSHYYALYTTSHTCTTWLCIVYHITHMYHITMHCIPYICITGCYIAT